MTESAGEITYTVDMETAALMRSTEKTDESLNRLQRGFDKTDSSAKSLGNTTGRTANEMRPLAAAIKRANDEASQGVSTFGKLSAVLGTFVGIGVAQQILQMTESYGEMSERVEMATKSQAEFEMVQQRLLASANETYRSLKQTQETYILTASSLRAMGYDANQALEVTESLALSFVKNATSAARADNAISAFSKSLSKGRVEAEAWETIIVATPSIADDLAEALGKTSMEIRKLGAEGKITADQLAGGLRKALDGNREAAAGMAVTVKDAYVQLINNLSVYLGEANKANEVTATMSLALQGVGKNIEAISKVLAAVGVGALAAYIAKQALLIVGTTQASLASRKLAVDELNAAKAHLATSNAALAQATAYAKLGAGSAAVTSATNAQIAATSRLAAAQAGAAGAGRLLLGALGGPVGIIALAASAAAGLYLFRDSADAAAPSVEALSRAVESLSVAEADLQKIQIDKQMVVLEERADNAFKALNRFKDVDVTTMSDALRESLARQRVDLEKTTLQIQEYAKRRKELDDYIKRPTDDKKPAAEPVATTSTEGQKRLKEMQDEIALLQLSGEARAKLQAIQRLGETATEQERLEAEKLAMALLDLEKKQKTLEESKRKQKAADDALIKSGKDNEKVVRDLGDELSIAALKGLDLARAAALLKLNKYATPEQIAEVKQLTAELFAQEQKLRDIALVKQLDPAAGAQADFDKQMEDLRRLNEAKLIEDQRYLELKTQLETAHADHMAQIEEQRFAAQSRTNQLLIDSLNEVQSAGTNAITGLLTGTNNLTDAMQQLGTGILHHAVGALVEMGVQYVKSMIMGQAAQATAAATAAATGASMATAYAPAAAMASLASFGANAAPAQAGIASTLGMAQSLAVAGGRLHGGPVSADGMYRINENGRPEVFNAANGQQYMLPNSRGEVVSNKNATGGGGVTNNITITVSDGAVQTSGGSDSTADSMALANGIRVVVVDELERQSRPGGTLWRMKNA
jgi:tape measure domain-containing protein